MDRPMVVESASIASRLLSDAGKTSAKQAEALASTVRTEAPSVLPTGQPAGVQVPRQSRAPVMCSDPSQPGCHVDVPDAPSHQGWSATLSNSGDVSLPSDVIPPPGSVAFHWAPHPDGGPYAAHGRLPWRPPAV